MDYSKAVCKDLPQELKNWFFSSRLDELKKAVEICETCPVKTECFELGISGWKNCGVWGGKILTRGKPFSERYLRSKSRTDGLIKFQWY